MKRRFQFSLNWLAIAALVTGGFFGGVATGRRCHEIENERQLQVIEAEKATGAVANKATVIHAPVISLPFNEKVTALKGADEFTTYASRKLYTSRITDADLLLCPQWNQDAESPPISARKAIGVATKMKDSLVKEDQRCKWLLVSLELRPTRSEQWVWVARICQSSRLGMSLVLRSLQPRIWPLS